MEPFGTRYQQIVPKTCSVIFCKCEMLCFGEWKVSVRRRGSRREAVQLAAMEERLKMCLHCS